MGLPFSTFTENNIEIFFNKYFLFSPFGDIFLNMG